MESSRSLIAATVTAVVLLFVGMSTRGAEARWCTLVPGSTVALVRVEQDTTFVSAPVGVEPMSSSSVRPGSRDSMLAGPGTPMPAARVRLLRLDSASRAILAGQGITDSQPVAFLKAAPYRSDCRTVRWTDTIPFAVRGEVGYVRATLAPSGQWIGGVPVLVVPDAWSYPYPRRRYLAWNTAPDAPLASAEAMYGLNALIAMPHLDGAPGDDTERGRVIAWARANTAAAELEPIRRVVRQAVLYPDWERAEQIPSRLRGSYRVEIEVSGERSTWFFRTHDRPGYPWRGADSSQTTAQLLASPHILGYQLVGDAAGSRDSLSRRSPRGSGREPLVWLSTADRPTAPGNGARRALPGELEFILSNAPARLWTDLEAFVPRLSVQDSTLLARINRPIPRGEKQVRLPLTVKLDERGGVRADTTLMLGGGRTLRVVLERMDTIAVKRPF